MRSKRRKAGPTAPRCSGNISAVWEIFGCPPYLCGIVNALEKRQSGDAEKQRRAGRRPTPFDRRTLLFFRCADDTLPALAERGGTERSRDGHVCEKCPLDKPFER